MSHLMCLYTIELNMFVWHWTVWILDMCFQMRPLSRELIYIFLIPKFISNKVWLLMWTNFSHGSEVNVRAFVWCFEHIITWHSDFCTVFLYRKLNCVVYSVPLAWWSAWKWTDLWHRWTKIEPHNFSFSRRSICICQETKPKSHLINSNIRIWCGFSWAQRDSFSCWARHAKIQTRLILAVTIALGALIK